MKLAFYLMNHKGYSAIVDFLNKFNSSSVEYVVLSRDEHVEKDYYNEIKNLCHSHSIVVFDRKDNIPKYSGYKVAIGWRWLIRDTSKLIVMHDSILPKYRGFSPLVNMLINGEKEIGVTALCASDNYDEGDIIEQRKVKIEYPIKIHEAIDKVSALYSCLVISIFQKLLVDGCLVGSPQNHNQATYSLWRDELDYLIDWSKDSSTIIRTIDALAFPYLGAKSYFNGKLITITEAEEVNDVMIENRDFGKVIFLSNGFPVVVCGEGLIKIRGAYDKDNNPILPLKKFRSRFGVK
ncbi:methionyl-tRNA formyltransferase [Alkalihalobacillus deserti]|uniref:methionyl-tRNA formyltransferase n=1 Tax=Alkalihalobacillus deserti TaxID=2879466 RepID=UPI001D15D8F7|nr:formyltransferase family protein [Alkalihalobacillus deserti]